MVLLRYEPWNTMERLHRQIDQIFGDSFAAPAANGEGRARSRWVPSVDVHEEADKFVVRADLPGVEPKDISITAENGVLTVSGRAAARATATAEGLFAPGARRRHASCAASRCRRTCRPTTIRARHSNGVLEVTIPKVPAAGAEARQRRDALI